MRLPVVLLVCLAVMALAMQPVAAHAPLAPGDNQHLADATVIPDPLKSFVIYGHLHDPGDIAYFRMDMHQGERLDLALNVNRAGAPVPDLIIMGPGIPSSGPVPPSLEIPPGVGVQVIPGTSPASAGYEAFSPSVIYEVAGYTTPANETGTWYAAVYNTGDELSYSFVAGYREQFTVPEWLAIPFSLIGISLWEGQAPWFIAAPYILVMLGGIAILFWQQRRSGRTGSVPVWLTRFGGLLYIGAGAAKIAQMFWVFSFTGYSPESTITLIFAVIPILLGIWALWTSRKEQFLSRDRIALIIIGVLGLATWAGLVVGPILILLAGFIPGTWCKKPKDTLPAQDTS